MQAVRNIKKSGLSSEICGLARTLVTDIDSVIKCDLNYVHTFIATSDIHMRYKLKMSPEEVIEKAVNAVEYAKSHGLQVEFSAEDATRSDIAFLTKVFASVVEAGADRIDVPDTVGYATPEFISHLVQVIKKQIDIPISLHCHNDFGLAVANSIAGINAGAACAHVTVNGLGERAGNASLEEFVMALQCLYKKEHNIRTKLLYETSRSVSNIMGIAVQAN
jgi:2-isopropylmalate synthase